MGMTLADEYDMDIQNHPSAAYKAKGDDWICYFPIWKMTGFISKKLLYQRGILEYLVF